MAGYIGADGGSHDYIKFFAEGEGLISLPVYSGDSRDTRIIGEYFRDIQNYMQGDYSAGSAISNKAGYSFRGYRLETNLNVIYDWASSGELSFPELYDN
ncbi:hypothetical protein [Streptomyces sp. NPDC058954]|uniref:hypothetical protein n=1 Tax=Streptomyces sp. NPDC058954 TaxID=3346677 RepID=UPI0036C341D8